GRSWCGGRATRRGAGTLGWSRRGTGLVCRRSCGSSWPRVTLICSEVKVAPKPLHPCGCVPHLRRVVPDADPGVPATEGRAGHSTRAPNRAPAQGRHPHRRRHPVRGRWCPGRPFRGSQPPRGAARHRCAHPVRDAWPDRRPGQDSIRLRRHARPDKVSPPGPVRHPNAAAGPGAQAPLRLDLDGVYWPLAIMAIVGAANAVNLTDGMDGLAGGLAAIAILGLAFLLPAEKTYEMAGFGERAVAMSLTGGVLAFLVYNRHPARVFMGDAGALGLGAALSAMAIQQGWLFLLMILGLVFAVETFSVIIQVGYFKATGGRRLFK